MSHIVKCKVEFKNETALTAAITALGLQNLGNKRHTLYDGSYNGIGVSLPGWDYPIVINIDEGSAKYDNYNGRWGKQIELDKLTQQYSIELTRQQAESEGYEVNDMTAQEAFDAGLIDELPEDNETKYLEMVALA